MAMIPMEYEGGGTDVTSKFTLDAATTAFKAIKKKGIVWFNGRVAGKNYGAIASFNDTSVQPYYNGGFYPYAISAFHSDPNNRLQSVSVFLTSSNINFTYYNTTETGTVEFSGCYLANTD